MNVFVVHQDPIISAEMLCDRHVVKMTLESAQMLSHAVHKLGSQPSSGPIYKELPKAHSKHPCTQWVMKSKENYLWLCTHAAALAKEYTFRYDKIHKSAEVIDWCQANPPERLPEIGLTPFALAVKQTTYENIIIPGDAVATYRKFYIIDKAKFASWKRGREKPDWYTI